MTKRYLYVGAYINLRTNDLLESNERKVGVTNDITKREYALNDTKGPIGYSMIAAFDFESTGRDAFEEEQFIHSQIKALDISMYGEWVDNCGVEQFVRQHCFRAGASEIDLELLASSAPDKRIIRNVKEARANKGLRVRVPELAGQTFSYEREGVCETIEITADGRFKSLIATPDVIYDSPHKPFRQAWQNIQGTAEINGWTSPKNTERRSIDDELALLPSVPATNDGEILYPAKVLALETA